MNSEQHKGVRNRIETTRGLGREVQGILSRCIYLFEEEIVHGESHMDVDAVVSGRSQNRNTRARRHTQPQEVRRPMAYAPISKPSRGSFIPHRELGRA